MSFKPNKVLLVAFHFFRCKLLHTISEEVSSMNISNRLFLHKQRHAQFVVE